MLFTLLLVVTILIVRVSVAVIRRRETDYSIAHTDPAKAVTLIAFGSCAQQDDPQPIWHTIANAKPDMFVFIGDNIYADTQDMLEMAKKYQQLGRKAEFAEFRARVPVLATWDDHDYGLNDGGKEYPFKQESKRQMLDFFNEPSDSERRTRPGVYTSYFFGPTGQRLQLILLDLRWFRDLIHWDDSVGGYVPNQDPTSTIMGAAQWAWLEEELKKPADLRIIASSIQFSSPDHHWEKWGNFPHEKARMLDMFDRLKVRNAVIVSGDMHFAELSAEQTPGGFTVYDLTSSGLNFFENGTQYPNRNRLALFDQSANFGILEITWQKDRVGVCLQARNLEGSVVINKDVAFDITK
jgi:alkaline phosphatase D